MNPEIKNKLILRQIQKHFGGKTHFSDEFINFFKIIGETYEHFEKDRKMLERSIDLSSNEMIELNKKLKADSENVKISFEKIKILNNENKEKLNIINENLPDIIFTVNNQKKITYVNKPINGNPPENLIGKNFFEILSNEHLEEFESNFNEALDNISQIFEIKTDIFERENCYYNVRINNYVSENGSLSNLIIFSNINVSKKAEEVSRENQKLINEIYSVLNEAVIIIDENGAITKWDNKCEDLFGWKETEVLDTLLIKKIAPLKNIKTNELPNEDNKKTKDGYLIGKTIDTKAFHKNGSEFDISMSIASSTINGKKYFIGFIRDVSERKLIENELLKQKKFTDDILNNIPADIAVFDTNHNYLFINKNGIKDEELRKWMINKNDFDYCNAKNKNKDDAIERRKLFNNAINSNLDIDWIDEYKMPDENVQFVFRKFHPVIENEEIKFVVGYGLDITELKKIEDHLKKTLFILNNKLNDLMQFNYIVSHNLRSPISNILALCDLMNLEEVNFTEKIKIIEMVKQSTYKIDELIFDLNSILENRLSLNLSKEKIYTKDVLSNIESLLVNQLKLSKASISINIDENAKEISGIKSYFESIFYNLISNSIKYKSIGRNLKIDITAQKKGEFIILKFEDNGRGIDLKTHSENIFGLYKRFHHDVEGKGLGLHMTKNQVEAMNGNIKVESEIEKGTKFILSFPI